MIERKFIKENMLEYEIKEFIASQLKRAGLSDVKFQRTPLGEKIVIYAHRPGLVVGRGGSNIAELTKKLKANFEMENPQVEIEEVENPDLDPNVIAERIANNLERFGPTRFKGIGYRALNDAMDAGARGVEILITGRVPSSRARKWRFYAGYLKKSGDTALTSVKDGFSLAVIKAGAVGIKVKIMDPDVQLPDDIKVHEAKVEEVTDDSTKVEVEKQDEQAEEDDSSDQEDSGDETAKDDSGEEKGSDEESSADEGSSEGEDDKKKGAKEDAEASSEEEGDDSDEEKGEEE